MNWFKNLKIGRKLVLSFIFVAFIAGAIGVEGILSLKSADDSDTILYEMNTVPLEQLSMTMESFQRLRVNLLEGIIAETPEEMQNQFSKVKERYVEVNKNLPLLEKTSVTAEGKAMITDIINVLNEFSMLKDRAIQLTQNGQAEEALFLFKNETDVARKKVEKAMNLFADMKVEHAKQRAEQNTDEANSSITLMIVLVIIGVLVSIALGYFIARLIGKPIERVVNMILEMGNAHFGDRLNIETKDEIGLLARTMDTFATAMQHSVVQTIVKISEGDTNVKVNVSDDRDELAPALNKLVEIIQDLISESKLLSQAAVDGKLSTRGNASKFQGGYREIVAGVNATLDAVVKPIDESSKVLEKLSQGDLTVRMEGEYKGDFALIKDSVNGLANSFNRIIGDVVEAVEATASASTQISSSAEEMAAGAQEQSSQTAEVAAAMEEMSRTIVETANNATVSAEASRDASVKANEGAAKLDQSKEGMRRIVTSTETVGKNISSLAIKTEQIGAIAQVIDDIADQTNLLALNAAIEAARAGEHGRGFAVVADEVRKLAENTTKATKEIANTIKSIQAEAKDANASMKEAGEAVNNGLHLNDEVGAVLTAILESIDNVTNQIEQVAAASEEQSATAEQVSTNIEAINNVANESAVGVQQIASASEDLNRLTENLSNLVSQFRINNTENSRSIGQGHKLLK